MQRDLTLIFGGDGTGKTSYVVQNILPKYSRILVFDAGFGDYPVDHLDSLDDLIAYLGNLNAFGSARPFKVAYTPTPDEYDLLFLLARDLGNCLIVAEECDRFNPMGPWETEYVYRGRHWNVSMVGLTIQPFGCPKDWRRIVKEVVSFRQVEPSDIDYIAYMIGDNAYEIPKLPGPEKGFSPPFPYLRWTPGTGATIEQNGSTHLLRQDADRNPRSVAPSGQPPAPADAGLDAGAGGNTEMAAPD